MENENYSLSIIYPKMGLYAIMNFNAS